MGIAEIVEIQNVNLNGGLNDHEVQVRLSEFNTNELKQEEKETIFLKFLGQLQEPMTVLLLISAFFSMLMGEHQDAVSIVCVFKLNF